MKNFTVPADVQAQLKALTLQIHEICLANDVPYISTFVLTSSDDGAEKVVSAVIKSDKDLAPDFLVAAHAVLTAPSLPLGMIQAAMLTGATVATLSGDDVMPDQCPCPECDLARSAAQPDEPDETTH